MAPEKRLIDANERIDLIRRTCCDGCKSYEGVRCRSCAHDDEIGLIEDAPTVDAVDVVRCKDCKHWHEETGWCYHHSHFIGADGEACHPWESSDWKMLNADDFCSYGERKTDKQFLLRRKMK